MSVKPNYLIAGLGNPGNKYSHTRHNIGFKVIDSVAHHYSIPLFKQDDVEYGMGSIFNSFILLVKPQDFMNRSGPPVYRLAQKYGIKEEKMIVIHDDLDLVFGRLKIKRKGGSGGHKGICSLIDAVGRKNFVRIRIGIGRPKNGQSIIEYILGEFTPYETLALDRLIVRVRDAIKTILCLGIQEAMNSFNNKSLKTSS